MVAGVWGGDSTRINQLKILNYCYMEIQELKKKAHFLIRNDNVEEALKLLDQLYFNREILVDYGALKELTLISSQFNKLKRDRHKNIISYEEETLMMSRIRHSLIEIIFQLEDICKNNHPDEHQKAILNESQVEKIALKTFNKLANFTDGSLKGFSSSASQFIKALNQHSVFVDIWSREINFREIDKIRLLSEFFIDPEFYSTPLKYQFWKEKGKKIKLNKLIKSSRNNIIILGQPGAGKTTIAKRICQNIIKGRNTFYSKPQIPIVIRLRDLNTPGNLQSRQNPIIQHIYDLLDLSLELNQKIKIDEYSYKEDLLEGGKEYLKQIKRVVLKVLELLGGCLILDGFDELHPSIREYSIKDIELIALNLKQTNLVLTSRTGEFDYNLPNAQIFEICPLSNEQQEDFIHKWIGNQLKATQLISHIKSAPYYSTINKPLTLAHLCSIFMKYGSIPEKPSEIYRKVINLLIEEWDSQRNITRNSKFSNFSNYRKLDFLANLAFDLTVRHNKFSFNPETLKEIYLKNREKFSLPEDGCNEVINELESHTGLFVQSKYNEYEFIHKTIQEYLTASYLIKLPFLPKELINSIPNELAVAISISSEPTDYFATLILHRDDIFKNDNQFFKSFILRLIEERPDFNRNLILGISFLYLFSLMQENELLNKAEVELGELLDLFYNEFNIKKALEDLGKYYCIDYIEETPLRFYSLEESRVHLLQLLKIPLKNLYIKDIDLPQKLITKGSFIRDIKF